MNPLSKIFPALIYFSAVICERVLREADQVCSAIRIVDIFYIDPTKTELPANFQRVVSMQLLIAGRFAKDAPVRNYDLTVDVESPDGKVGSGGDPIVVVPSQVAAGAPSGFAVQVS